MLVFLLFVALLLPTLAGAEDFVCGDVTKLNRYTHSVDPTKVPTCPVPFLLSQIPEAQIPAQAQLYASVPARHLKVVAGLMVEMTQAEKDAVDRACPTTGRRDGGRQKRDCDE